ncbi:hypothetical protein TUM19329_03290 [Legionella antarctica]|uniref:Pirin-like protein n=1 Tax=Legionella antarctica TaxID=2708020 RepID=A0A6F8T0Q2_9GAMM|nr:pirin family protein [Legionella antarctica]BCA93968.1 hypothetical protein TUM19329_03290 [Legionella antarctica]
MKAIEVGQLIDGRLMREGAGVKLNRYIGADRTNEFEPILLFDYFDSSDSLDYIGGFPPHPHRGFETVTYLLHGALTHEDNQGHKGVLRSGDVQWMTAGKGIIHSEMPSASSGRLQGLQLWLNLPAAKKMVEPRYQELLSSHLPLETKECGAVIKVIAGRTDQGTRSPITGIATKPLFLDIRLPAGTSVQQHILRDYQAILFVVSGEVGVGQQKIKQEVLAGLTAGDLLTLKSEQDSHCLLIAAAKLHEPITRYGPFVMNTQTEVMQALDDFRNGRF